MENIIFNHLRNNKILYIVFAIILTIMFTGLIYMNGSYTSMKEAKTVLNSKSVFMEENDWYFAKSNNSEKNIGLIIYPGGRVEAESYLPLAEEISKFGINCFVVPMPFNLPVIDADAAIKVMREYIEIENWFIAGHSLGGAMATKFSELYPHKLKGLILLAAYTPENVAVQDLPVLSITASNDKILDKNKFKNRKDNLPDNTRFITIKGGNHSQFGWYGFQKGDGKATITRDEQLHLISDNITVFIYDNI